MVLPIALALREYYVFFFELDELQGRILMDALLVTLLATVAMVISVGFLQYIAKVPTFNVLWLWIPISLCYAVAGLAAKRRYS